MLLADVVQNLLVLPEAGRKALPVRHSGAMDACNPVAVAAG